MCGKPLRCTRKVRVRVNLMVGYLCQQTIVRIKIMEWSLSNSFGASVRLPLEGTLRREAVGRRGEVRSGEEEEDQEEK